MDSGESFCDLCTRLGLHDTPLIDIIEEIDRLRTFIAEKDREIEQLEAENDNMRKIFDGLMAILPPEYFVKEDGDDSTVEDFRQPSSGGD
jgi:hypothetical protein